MDNKENEKKWKHRRRRRHGKRQDKAPVNETESLAPKASEPETEAAIEDASLPCLQKEQTVSEGVSAENDIDPVEEQKKITVVGIRFRPVGKNYSFDPASFQLKMGENVIVETSQGTEFGTVSLPNHTVFEKDLVLPLRKVIRLATQTDLDHNAENRALELRARKTFLEKVQEHKLDMALSDVECTFDRSKLIFYFTSDGRVDFREFVKDMASIFKTRIELRQIGVRDEAKQLGGLGICGRPLCCSSFLDDFQQVSIKMAKEQNLSLNPTKISGTCGRLMCCLRYENDVYVEASKRCPKVDQWVMTEQGKGTVAEVDILREVCKVRLDSDPDVPVIFPAKDVKVIPKQSKSANSEKNRLKQEEN